MGTKFEKIIAVILAMLLIITTGQAATAAAEAASSDEAAVDEASEQASSETEIDIPAAEPVDIASMEKVAENEFLQLFVDRETTEVAVKETAGGHVWYSNPADRGEDTIATGENRGMLNSLVVVSYFNVVGQTTRMDSYKDSVMKEQVEIEAITDGIKIMYSFGDAAKGIEQIPRYISRERFETIILGNIEDEAVRQDIAKRFKYLEEEEIYERRDASFPKVILERTLQLFEEIGYTEEELAYDNAEHGDEPEEESGHPSFLVPLSIQLDGRNLLVTVDGKSLEFNEAYPLNTLQIMPFFGAANARTEGYIFVPDGSGALIELNNGKADYQAFSAPVYGKDRAISERADSLVSENIHLPVFGMKQGEHAFLAMIEEGDGIASIHADVAGRVNAYNSVFSAFTIKESGEITLSGGDRSSTVSIFQKGEYEHNISIRYGFLHGDDADYAGMATLYQDYLTQKHNMQPLEVNNGDSLPFFLELTGSIWKRNTFLGIPYKQLEPLTTFEEAVEILEELAVAGIDNIKLRYTGWFNGGVDHKAPTTINVDKNIGGEQGLLELARFLADHDIDFYPDVAFMKVYRNSLSFRPSSDASRFITRKIAEVYPYNPASYRQDIENRTPYYILSPGKLPDYAEQFLDDYRKLNFQGLSLRDLGNELHSDFRETNVVDREEAKMIVSNQLEELAADIPDILAVGGNAMVLPYAKTILHAPLSSSEFNITDRSVPFYQMVVRGYLDYAGTPMNLRADQSASTLLLKSLETGASVYFQWFYQGAAAVKDTEFDYMYSSNYRLWLEDAAKIYAEVNEVLNPVRTEPITAHEQLAAGVYKTTYGSDYSVIVNYNDKAVVIDGIVIDAEGYTVRKGNH
ncbi:hypothetical protein SAMN05421736_104307 [Evansella caseinilytica]|uniref:Uncharacterized protein n=1 Tax=Evansella caseinilytica TaxID=1503961 RepID=A0A1H3P2T3_9BACI|nr:DUF5696 domain-containing protein [Evansella caseinilytica]SDY95361.1 hypothetical protein SAMN05421736_104307 [Evansella caseinilytica]